MLNSALLNKPFSRVESLVGREKNGTVQTLLNAFSANDIADGPSHSKHSTSGELETAINGPSKIKREFRKIARPSAQALAEETLPHNNQVNSNHFGARRATGQLQCQSSCRNSYYNRNMVQKGHLYDTLIGLLYVLQQGKASLHIFFFIGTPSNTQPI